MDLGYHVIDDSNINEILEVCEYCGDFRKEKQTCCGEAHFREMVFTNDGGEYWLDEVSIINNSDDLYDFDR